MFSQSMMTYTGSLVNKVEEWSQSRVSSIANVLFPTRLLGAAGIASAGTLECIATGLQFLLLLAPVIVKKTLQVLRIRSLSDRLPHMGFGTLWFLFRRTIALGLVVLLGAPATLWQPETGILVYDAMGLQRRLIAVPISERFSPMLKLVERVAVSTMTLIRTEAAHLQIVAVQLYCVVQNYPEVVLGAGIGVGSWWAYRKLFIDQFTEDPPPPDPLPKQEVTTHEVMTPFGILPLPEWKWETPLFGSLTIAESTTWGFGMLMTVVLAKEVHNWCKAKGAKR